MYIMFPDVVKTAGISSKTTRTVLAGVAQGAAQGGNAPRPSGKGGTLKGVCGVFTFGLSFQFVYAFL